MNDKSCGNCVNCYKYMVDGVEKWFCEDWDKGVGMPYGVNPPNDDACSNWSDKPEDKDKAADSLRAVVDSWDWRNWRWMT